MVWRCTCTTRAFSQKSLGSSPAATQLAAGNIKTEHEVMKMCPFSMASMSPLTQGGVQLLGDLAEAAKAKNMSEMTLR